MRVPLAAAAALARLPALCTCVFSLAQETITVYIWLSRTPPWHEDHRNKVREWLFAEQEQTEATSQLLSFVKEQKERERQLRGTWDAHEEPEGRGAGAGQRVIGCEDVGAEEVVVVEGAPCCIARATVSTQRVSLRRRGVGRPHGVVEEVDDHDVAEVHAEGEVLDGLPERGAHCVGSNRRRGSAKREEASSCEQAGHARNAPMGPPCSAMEAQTMKAMATAHQQRKNVVKKRSQKLWVREP